MTNAGPTTPTPRPIGLGWRNTIRGPIPPTRLITYGYNAAVLMARVLKDCGGDLSRQHINDVANNLHDVQLPMFLPGVLVNTTPRDHTIVGTLQIVRFNGKGWDPVGGPVHK